MSSLRKPLISQMPHRNQTALNRQRRSAQVNGAAEPRRLPLQVPRPPAAGRGDGSITHERCSGTLNGVAQVGEVRLHAQASPVLRCLLVFTMGERHFSTRNMELVATAVARLEDEDDPPAPTALGGRPASCKQLPHP